MMPTTFSDSFHQHSVIESSRMMRGILPEYKEGFSQNLEKDSDGLLPNLGSDSRENIEKCCLKILRQNRTEFQDRFSQTMKEIMSEV